MQQTIDSIAEDRLVGVAAIAAFRGEPIRRCRYLIERCELPVGREGSLIVASKRVLTDHWLKLAGAADPKAA